MYKIEGEMIGQAVLLAISGTRGTIYFVPKQLDRITRI